MTEPERQALRHAIDEASRRRITGGLHPDPCLVGQCDHCGRRYQFRRRGQTTRFCSNGHRVNYHARMLRRLARMAA